MIIEVTIGDGRTRPKVMKQGDDWVVVGEVSGCVQHVRALWARTFAKKGERAKDGKGFLVSGIGKLTRG